MSTEALIPLRRVAEIVEDMTGDLPNRTTCFRWATRGLTGRDGTHIRLRHRRVGRRIYTTREALDDFIGALTESDERAIAARVA